MSFYKDYKEFIDQPLHVLMGAVLAFAVAYPLSYIVPFWGAITLGAAVSGGIWRVREWWQHKDHDHEPRYWFSLDLAFVDLGVVVGVVAAWLL